MDYDSGIDLSMENLSNQLQQTRAQLQHEIALRKTVEQEGERLQNALRLVVESTAGATDESFFEALAINLARATGVHATMVTELVPESKYEACTRALCIDGEIHPNMRFVFKDFPCEEVIAKKQAVIYKSDVKRLFPRDQILVDLNAESYMGIPYFGSDGRLLGHLVLLDTRPITNGNYLLTIGRLFATRAGVELERSQTLRALQHRVELEKLLAEISTSFINVLPDQLDVAINQALASIGKFAGVDRSYVFLFSEDGKQYSNTHEWCAPGVASRIANLKDLPAEDLGWIMDNLQHNDVLHIPSVDELPPQADALKNDLRSKKIRSILEVPMMSGNRLIGLLGFNTGKTEKTWAEEDIRILRIVGETFVNALERKRYENELQTTQAQLLHSEKMATLGKLTASLSHEVNTPLGAAKSAADIIARCGEKISQALKNAHTLEQIQNSEAIRECLGFLTNNTNVIFSATERIGKIVTSLKMLARLEDAQLQVIDLHETLDSTLTLLESDFKNKIHLVKEYAELPGIVCYPGELNQVFLNLLTNAAQAIKDSGTITIRTFIEDGKVQIQIMDTGVGISLEELPDLFQPHFSKNSGRVKAGLGLFTSHHIVQKHGGEIRVESRSGEGSCFTVVLPVR